MKLKIICFFLVIKEKMKFKEKKIASKFSEDH